ncbi:MAG: hypothetical protein NZ553_18130 [Caldilinea sp.]|nr:hypothetical protein [Caldilinea sp.]MDW8442400.1 hypothetical protein [Caldilineaceae bacterium]
MMKDPSFILFIGFAALLLLAGCASPLAEEPKTPVEQEVPPSSPLEAPASPLLTPLAEYPALSGGVTGEAPADLLEAILADAASRTGLERDALLVLQDEAVVWSDGSLGCPEPDMMYTQALVEGYHVIVQAGDRQLDYRASHSGFFKLCENPLPPGAGRASEMTPDR